MMNKNSEQSTPISRRRFLGQASCSALGTTGLFSTLMNLQATRKATAAELNSNVDDYKALVVVYLLGGNDSYNMLVPTNSADYAQYQAVRSDIALRKDGNIANRGPILDLNALETGGRSYGVHPSMGNIRNLFNQGHLNFVANVGTLIEPLTIDQYKNGTRDIPRSLFSHNDQQMQWQTAIPQYESSTGWAGRMADLLHSQVNALSQISMNISLNGLNQMQTGEFSTAFIMSDSGAAGLLGRTSSTNSTNGLRVALLASEDTDDTSLAGLLYRDLFQNAYMHELRRSVENERAFSAAFDASVVNAGSGSQNGLTADLHAVARTIQASGQLNLKRQIFFVGVGGWDMHDELLGAHQALLAEVDEGLNDFWNMLGEIGMQDNVLTITGSDFSRTLRTNGRGTDHAWGGNVITMGGPVNGQRVHGSYPTASEMQLGTGLDVGNNGRMLPTTSVDEYFAEAALWFGVPYNSLADAFPNVGNFYSSRSNELPVGYLDVNAMPPTAFPGTIPTAVSISEAEAYANSEKFPVTRSGLVVGTGAATAASLLALRQRRMAEMSGSND